MATVHDVAAAVLERHGRTTTMKLEKLVYYCQGWHLARHGSPLFDETLEAWQQGPVAPALFKHHRQQREVANWPLGSAKNLTPMELSSVRWVVSEYGKFTASELSEMTHQELPWKAARVGLSDSQPSDAPISTDLMRIYYARQIAEAETSVALATSNAAIEGVEFTEDWQDRLRDVATGRITADDLVAEVIGRLNRG
ncbi:putative phage-associated protein [Asanoa ferruginea]|uniref:Putative phage-associated protein n=1 Tax=Asanoa ferruginea TaxID=53367 RepID=A0A3D9ZMQ8_9ACTN|nr:type II toxin-antitoxin system antitoxin SocA domain-containing protein [Asanoa ferruginea]REF97213.1 putative phage-associated protein [Asanoa ferruginea]GIF49137.1 hypothetical protein Afe04nite_36760 [Asanoa ferruginea]